VLLQLLTGKGALQQLGFETGLPIQDLDGLVLFIIAFNLIAALLPAKVRSKGAPGTLSQPPNWPSCYFGIKVLVHPQPLRPLLLTAYGPPIHSL
jgi:hypothetical protein